VFQRRCVGALYGVTKAQLLLRWPRSVAQLEQ